MTTIRRPRRFKIQYRVDLTARDRSNKKFLLGIIWRTVSQADRIATAERVLLNRARDYPHREFRIAEEWPIGAELRVIK